MIYLDHRRFLPLRDPLRLDSSSIPSKKVCAVDAPLVKTQTFIDTHSLQYMSLSTIKEKKEYAQKIGCTGITPLRTLSHHDRHLSTPVEPMYFIKGIGEHLIKLIILCGLEDSVKVRNEEKSRMRFTSSWVSSETDTQASGSKDFHCLRLHFEFQNKT